MKKANAIDAGGDLVTDFSVDSTADVTHNKLTLNGNLAVSGFHPAKRHIAFAFESGATSTTKVPGYVFRSNVSLATRTIGALCNFTCLAHPKGGELP